MRRIALEEHYVMNEPEHIDRWKSVVVSSIPPAEIDKILPTLTDLGDQRLEAMAAAGIDHAILSNVGSVQGVTDETYALRLAREANDHLADIVRAHPDHYSGFATVPLQDPHKGAEELERGVRELGLKGTMLLGTTGGRYLDDPAFEPFWERVDALGCPVYLHAADAPQTPIGLVGAPELSGATWAWTSETATHALRLVLKGVFTKYPNVTFMLGHMGETLPYLLWRLDRRSAAFAGGNGQAAPATPSDIIKNNVFMTTAGVFQDTSLRCAIDSVGIQNIMFSVDHPFESMTTASTWLDNAPLADDERDAISWRNASRLFGL